MMRKFLIAAMLALASPRLRAQNVAIAVPNALDAELKAIPADSLVAYCVDQAYWDQTEENVPRVSTVRVHRANSPVFPECSPAQWLIVRPMCWLRADEVFSLTAASVDLVILLCGPPTADAPRSFLKVFYKALGTGKIS